MTDPNRQTPDSPTTLRGVVDRLHDAANKEETSLNDVVEGLGHASFVPVLLVPALAVIFQEIRRRGKNIPYTAANQGSDPSLEDPEKANPSLTKIRSAARRFLV